MRAEISGQSREAFRCFMRPGLAADVEPFDIEIEDGARLPKPPGMRRYSPEHQTAINSQIAELLDADIVRVGTGSAIVSPVLLTRKKDGINWRLVVDHRGVNRVTVPNPWPFPRLEEVLGQTHGSHLFRHRGPA